MSISQQSLELDVDPELLLLIPFGMFTAVSLDLVSASVVPIIDPSETLVSTGDIDWSLARGGSLVILLFALLNRDRSIRDTNGIDLWIVYATIALVAAPPFVGALEDTLAGGTLAGVVAWTAQSTGYALVTLVN